MVRQLAFQLPRIPGPQRPRHLHPAAGAPDLAARRGTVRRAPPHRRPRGSLHLEHRGERPPSRAEGSRCRFASRRPRAFARWSSVHRSTPRSRAAPALLPALRPTRPCSRWPSPSGDQEGATDRLLILTSSLIGARGHEWTQPPGAGHLALLKPCDRRRLKVRRLSKTSTHNRSKN
jgi:hypothetical protein